MAEVNYAVPTIGQPNATEDVDIYQALAAIKNTLNGGIDNENAADGAGFEVSKLETVPEGNIIVGNTDDEAEVVEPDGAVAFDGSGGNSLHVGNVPCSGNTAVGLVDTAFTGCSKNDFDPGFYRIDGFFDFDMLPGTGASCLVTCKLFVAGVAQNSEAHFNGLLVNNHRITLHQSWDVLVGGGTVVQPMAIRVDAGGTTSVTMYAQHTKFHYMRIA